VRGGRARARGRSWGRGAATPTGASDSGTGHRGSAGSPRRPRPAERRSGDRHSLSRHAYPRRGSRGNPAIARSGVRRELARAAGATINEGELAQAEGALMAAELAHKTRLVAHAAFPGANHLDEALASARAAMAAAHQAGAPFLLLSSTTVYGRPRNLPCEEG